MRTNKLIKIVLEAFFKNMKDIKDKKYLDLSLEFIRKEEKFKQIVNQDSSNIIATDEINREKQMQDYLNNLNDLSKRLNIISNEFKDYCEKHEIKYTNQYDVISYIILENINNIFSNDENLLDINSNVGFNLFILGINYVDLYNRIQARIDVKRIKKQSSKSFSKLVGIDYVDDSNEEKISYRQMIRIIFNITYMLSMLREKMSAVAVKKVLALNDITINLSNKRGQTIDLFDMLFDYDELKKNENMNDEKGINILCELVDKNGMFNVLTEHEIIELLYNYIVVYNRKNDILSEKEEYGFKDLNPIIEIIERRIKDGHLTSSKIIDDIASGRVNIPLNEQSSNQI